MARFSLSFQILLAGVGSLGFWGGVLFQPALCDWLGMPVTFLEMEKPGQPGCPLEAEETNYPDRPGLIL